MCGADGIEYPSACKAACANVTVQLDAPCACLTCAVVTPTPKTQVCGVNNVTYDTTCAATCRVGVFLFLSSFALWGSLFVARPSHTCR